MRYLYFFLLATLIFPVHLNAQSCNTTSHTAGYKKLGNGKTVYVKAGNQSYYKNGTLKKAILYYSTYLKAGDGRSYYITDEDEVSFFENGSLKKAKLAYNAYIKDGNGKSHYVNHNFFVRFYKNGALKYFQPTYNQYYKLGNGKSVYIADEGRVSLYKNGMLKEGTLAISTNLKTHHGYEFFQSGQELEFEEDGTVKHCN